MYIPEPKGKISKTIDVIITFTFLLSLVVYILVKLQVSYKLFIDYELLVCNDILSVVVPIIIISGIFAFFKGAYDSDDDDDGW